MSEIRSHGRELLDQARHERTPGAADRKRVFGALMASAALATTTTAAAVPAALETKLLTGFSKWLVLAGLAGTVAGSVYLAGHVRVKAPVAVSTAPVVKSLAPPAVPVTRAPVADPAPAVSTEPLPRAAPRASSLVKRDAAAPGLEAELAGLHAAHAAYRSGNAGRALELLAEHQARFPKSQLATERATLEVLSLCRVGRTGDARSLAARLRKSSASAAALSGLDGSCAAK